MRNFFSNPESSAIKLVLALFFFILVGVFTLGNIADREAEQSAKVFDTAVPAKVRPWQSAGDLKTKGRLPERTSVLEVSLAYDKTKTPIFAITDTAVKQGHVPRRTDNVHEQKRTADYALVVKDASGKILSSQHIPMPDYHAPLPDPNAPTTTVSTGDVSLPSATIGMTLPMSNTAATVSVIDLKASGKPAIATTSIASIVPINNPETFKSLRGDEFKQGKVITSPVSFFKNLFTKKAEAYGTGSQSALEIVFIGNGYGAGSLGQFHSDVDAFIAKTLATEPFKSRSSEVVFSYIDNTTNLNCVHNAPPLDRLVTCDNALATSLVNTSGVPYDFISIITNDTVYGGSGGQISVDWNGSSGPAMFLHEFGHSFGRMVDEYNLYGTAVNGTVDNKVHNLGNTVLGMTQGNCYAGTPPATSWASLVGPSEYTTPCNYTNWYRAGSTSIMDNLSIPYFDAPSQQMLNAALDAYAGVSTDLTKPTVSITAPISTQPISGSVSVSANITDNAGVGYVHVVLDGVIQKTLYTPTSGATYSYTIPSLTNGSHTIEVRAYDAAGNMGSSQVVVTVGTVVSDTQAPSAPSNLTSSNLTTSGVSLNWSASTDDTGVIAYDIYKNAALLSSVSTTNYSVTGLTASTTYSFYVRARDAAGNTSTPSNTISVTTTSATGGTLAITNPINGQTLTPGIPISVDVSVATGTTKVELYRKFGNYNMSKVGNDSSAPFSFAWTPQSVGTYTMYAKAYNGGTLLGTASNTVVTVGQVSNGGDTQAPSAPSNLSLLSKTATTAAFTWSASTDNVGVTSYDVYKNGVFMDSTTTATSITATGLSASTSYTFTIKAKDAAGNISAVSAGLSVTTDAPPDTTPPSAPQNLQVVSKDTSNVSFSWNASTDNVGVTGYKVYRSTTLLATVTTTSYTATGLTAGTSYNFTVNAIDAMGNTSTTSPILSVTTNTAIDTQAPTAPTNLSSPSKTSSSVSVSWDASSDNVGVTGYDIYTGGSLSGSSTSTSYTVTGLSAGTNYSFTIKARDAAGNVSSASYALFVTTSAAQQSGATTLTISATPMTVTATSSQTVTVDVAVSGTIQGGVQFWRSYSSFTPYGAGGDSQAPYQSSWNTSGFGNGNYTMYATATAADGTTVTSNSIVITLNK